MKGRAGDLEVRRSADGADGTFEAIEHINERSRWRGDNTGRSFADFDLGDARTRGRDGDDAVGAEHRHKRGARIWQPRHAARIANGLQSLGEWNRARGVGEVRIEIDDRRRADATSGDEGRKHLGELAVELRLEANLVAGLDADGEELPTGRNGDAGDGVHQTSHIGRGKRCGVDDGDVVVDHAPSHAAGPVAAVVIDPLTSGVLADDVSDRGRIRLPSGAGRIEGGARVGRRIDAGVRAGGVAHHIGRNHDRVVARLEHREVDLGGVGARRQCAGLSAEDCGGGERGRGEVRIEGDELRVNRQRDERLCRLRGEHDVRGFVADENGSGYAHGREVDHAERVGDLVDDPGLGVVARAHAHWIDADLHRSAAHRKSAHEVEDLQLTVGGVDREQRGAVWRDVDRMHLWRLEVHERAGLAERGGRKCGRNTDVGNRERVTDGGAVHGWILK